MIRTLALILATIAAALWPCSVLGQTYRPTDGPLHSWVAANGKPGSVLTLPAGSFELTGPIFVNGFTLRGEDADSPTVVRPRGHGLIWVGQPTIPLNLAPYKVGLALWTKPPGVAPATFDATETPLNRPLHRVRRLSITLDLDTPGGSVEPGGLFNFGPIWCWWHPNAPRGPEMFLTTGSTPFDPDGTTETQLTWSRPQPAERTRLVWTIDLDAGSVGLSCNGVDLGSRTMPAGRRFPAITNTRATIGSAQQEANEIKGRWMLPGGVPDRRIRGFDAVADGVSIGRIAINSEWLLGVWSPDGGGPLYPVPYDPAIYRWVGGTTRLANLDIRPMERFKTAVRVGQIMGRCDFRNLRSTKAAVAIRKLPGLVSYTHHIDGLTTEYSPAIVGYGMTIHASDWTIRYPTVVGVSLADSNLRLERWETVNGAEDKTGSDLQAMFDFAAVSNGGNVSLTGGSSNDESGRVAFGAWLQFTAGSEWTSNVRLKVEDSVINAPGYGVPAYWLRTVPWASRSAIAEINASHWGTPGWRVSPNWTVDSPDRPSTPAPVTP